MKLIATLLFSAVAGLSASAQLVLLPTGGFENWGGNPSPGVAAEPNGWYSNQSGSAIASAGPQTCFQDNTIFHSGTSSVRLQNATIFGTVVNGNVTTGVINAPTITKSDGYIGTRNYDDSTDIRRMAFTGLPDSLVGWYQYTSGGTGEMGKVRAILHNNHYYDPETGSTYHPDPTANKVADALFLTPTGNTSIWTRFSVPFNYVAGATGPTYIMVNMTPSDNQLTTFSGSKLWIDDLATVTNPIGVPKVTATADDANVYSAEKTVYVKLNLEGQSEINIFDMAGRKVFAATMNNSQLNMFRLSDAMAGIYVYQLSNSSFCKTGKLVLQ